MPAASDHPSSTSRLRASGLLVVEAALVGALVNLGSTVGFSMPEADPFGGRPSLDSLATAWPGGLRRGAVVGVVLAGPVALVLGLYPRAAAWRWTPVVLALVSFAVTVFLTAGAIGGLLMPFEKVLEESWLPLWAGGVAFLLVLVRGAPVARRFRVRTDPDRPVDRLGDPARARGPQLSDPGRAREEELAPRTAVVMAVMALAWGAFGSILAYPRGLPTWPVTAILVTIGVLSYAARAWRRPRRADEAPRRRQLPHGSPR